MIEKLKLIGAGVMIGLISAGVILIFASPSRETDGFLLPTPESADLTIFVTGEVHNGGVFHLPETSRVGDAIAAAGGWTETADREAVNLAAFLVDGQAIIIPSQDEGSSAIDGTDRSTPLLIETRIDINTATVDELDTLPGIGPEKAKEIIAYRQKNGAFDTIEAILDVPGIGPSLFENIKDLITISNIYIGD